MVRPQSRRLARNKVGKKSRVKQLVEMPRTLLGQNFDFQTFLMRARIRLYLVYTIFGMLTERRRRRQRELQKTFAR